MLQRPSHLMLDFFGTMVRYSPSRTEQGFDRSHAVLRSCGSALDYPDFLALWSATSARFDADSAVDDHEFSMDEVTEAFLRSALGRAPASSEVQEMRETYISEWNKGVTYPSGMADLVERLASDYTVLVVTNTHQADLVPRHLRAMGVDSYIADVVTSVEVGWRKPHPAIYQAALRRASVEPADAVFVGDTYAADYEGPRLVGMSALLIDPEGGADIPPEHRLDSLFDLSTVKASDRWRDLVG